MSPAAVPLVVVVAGGPASGKSTLTAAVAAELNAVVLSADDFWAGRKSSTLRYRWEDPDGYDLAGLADQLDSLAVGGTASVTYGSREAAALGDAGALRILGPASSVVCEGFCVLTSARIVDAASLAVWVEVPEQVLVERRLARASHLGLLGTRSDHPDWVQGPMLDAYRSFAQLQRDAADLIVDGCMSTDALCRQVLAVLHESSGRRPSGAVT